MKITRSTWALAALLLLFTSVNAQFGENFYDSTEYYFVQPYLSLGFSAIGHTANTIALKRLRSKDLISEIEFMALTTDNLIGIDRNVLEQEIDDLKQFSNNSDRWRDVGIISPVLLFLDKKVRSQWLDIILMYSECHALNGAIYAYSPIGPTFLERNRPIVYYDDVALLERNKGRNRNSFFSGHVSTTATGSFFTAKVLSDLHPEWGAKRILLFAGAAISPAMVAIYRVKSLNHFPTDTIIGMIVGAFSGIAIPHLHRKRQNKLSVALNYEDNAMLMSAIWKF